MRLGRHAKHRGHDRVDFFSDTGFFAMTNNPWDILPMPEKGDEKGETLFAAVGNALTRWEELEEELADIFAVFVGAPTLGLVLAREPAVRAYGSINNFYGRAEALEAAASSYFTANKAAAAELEADLRGLMKKCRNFAGQRNNIAHGRKNFLPTKGHYLLPAFYNTRKYPTEPVPSYAYTSKEIDYYAGWFGALTETAQRLNIAASAIALNTSPATPWATQGKKS
jgi:hypothetical protein